MATMTTNTMQKAAGATNTNGLHTDTNGIDFRTVGAVEQSPNGKAIATQIAHLALAGHTVHQLADGGYLVSKYSYTHHANDFAALQDFARKLGVNK
jgi:hypothetical protein